MLKEDYGIKLKHITTRNPQANSIVERVHQVISNMVRTFDLQERQLVKEKDLWKGIFSALSFSIRSTVHTTLNKTSGQLGFGRDMILNIVQEANWELIRKRKKL